MEITVLTAALFKFECPSFCVETLAFKSNLQSVENLCSYNQTVTSAFLFLKIFLKKKQHNIEEENDFQNLQKWSAVWCFWCVFKEKKKMGK